VIADFGPAKVVDDHHEDVLRGLRGQDLARLFAQLFPRTGSLDSAGTAELAPRASRRRQSIFFSSWLRFWLRTVRHLRLRRADGKRAVPWVRRTKAAADMESACGLGASPTPGLRGSARPAPTCAQIPPGCTPRLQWAGSGARWSPGVRQQ
jgi:hypothetical protein